MSVLVLDTKVIEALYDKMCSYQNHKTCDINYSSKASRMFDQGAEHVQKFLTALADLNELSYAIKYRENINGPMLSAFIKYERTKTTINTYQFLKYLQCLSYNIEQETIEELRGPLSEQEQNAIGDLEALISDVQNAIIDSLPEYGKAKWSEA